MEFILYVFGCLLILGVLRKTFSTDTDKNKLQKLKNEIVDLGIDTVSTSRKVLEASREVLDFK